MPVRFEKKTWDDALTCSIHLCPRRLHRTVREAIVQDWLDKVDTVCQHGAVATITKSRYGLVLKSRQNSEMEFGSGVEYETQTLV